MSINLKPHNVVIYEKVKKALEESDRTALIQPTGTGKMYIALKLAEENKEKRAIYIAPSNAILHDIKKNIFAEGMTMVDFPNLKRVTYRKLAMLSDEEIEKIKVDFIFIDEFHHCGALEWGEGVRRLIEKNPNAKILGLSATPIRYSDGLRDMADEMFENKVASEMTLEEAIESGILPEAAYVSALYSYEQELGRMQINIDKMNGNIENKKRARELLNELRKKLDESTQNLPELLAKHMKNKSGKYIVFCKSIDDMKEKMKQAQEIFGGVNSNIRVRAVSFRTRESDKILTEFEQDTEEETLKLLYAVDMINEGYHVRDIDGVVMMRPTHSPAVFIQQLGRGLTVGSDKKVVIIDLVNNFDSCKIIEDLAKKMKQYRGRKSENQEKEEEKRQFSIFDTTKEFREIAARITALSQRKRISLEEKIQIFERFSQSGEELVGNTIFEGYPIGQWAIQIRSQFNRSNNGKTEKSEKTLSEEQEERLKRLGILDRKLLTIDEQIDKLIGWREKYPKATLVPIASEEVLSEYAKTEKEKRELLVEYEKMLKYYEYVRVRKSKQKLSEEQIEKCIEGNVGGVFGTNPKETHADESETIELIEKYGLNEEIINLIRKKYGSVNEFRKIYIEALINQNVDEVIDKKILENTNLIRRFDLSSSDLVARYSRLGDELIRIEGAMFVNNWLGIEEKLVGIIREGNFKERDKKILCMFYGMDGEKRKTQSQIAKELDLSLTRIQQIVTKTTRIISFLINSYEKQLHLKNIILAIDHDLQKEFIEEYFKNFDIFASREPISMDENVKNKLTNMLLEGVRKTKKREEQIEIIERMPKEQQLEILKERFGERMDSSDKGFIRDSYKECLNSQFCQSKIVEFTINNLTAYILENSKKEELEASIANNEYFSEKKKSELRELLNEKTRVFIKEKILIQIENWSFVVPKYYGITLEELALSIRTYNCLYRAGFNKIEDFVGVTKEQLMRTRNLGKVSLEEIMKKLQSLGLEIIDEVFEYVGEKEVENSEAQIGNADENTKTQIEEEINSSDVLSDDEKESLRKMLNEKYQRVKGRRNEKEIVDSEKTRKIMETTIEELDLSVRTFTWLKKAGFNGIEDFVGKSIDDLMEIRNFRRRSMDELLGKLKALGIEIIDGQLIANEMPHNSDSEISDGAKTDNQEIQSDLDSQETSKPLEEQSKEELVQHILAQQRTIAEQREQIAKLSSQTKEEIDEQ